MNSAKMILKKLIYPPKWVLFTIVPISFATLIFIFAAEKTESMLARFVYGMSAYFLPVLIAAISALAKKIKLSMSNSRALKAIVKSNFGGKYLNDLAFRGGFSIYQGVAVNFLYVIFRIGAGIRYHSVWFISMAAYYLVLGGLRANLVYHYKKHEKNVEIRCYRQTAWLLFLLNIPMGGMIVLMVRTNSGFSYPGYIIYLSAIYTFYAMIISVINLVKFRRLGSPILSAAKVLNFVSAMMSVLGLQTAMISRFSENGENYREMMNAVTGAFVWEIVIVIVVYMLFYSKKMMRKKVKCYE